MNELPPGFTLDEPKINGLPTGFTLDKPMNPVLSQHDAVTRAMLLQYKNQIEPKTPKPFEQVAGFTKDPIVPQPIDNIDAPQWGAEHPNLYGLYGAGKEIIDKAVKPTVEAAGMALGSAASPIAGTAIGYEAAHQGMDLVQDYYNQLGGDDPKYRTVSGELLKTGANVGAMIAIGKAFDAAVPVYDYITTDLPKRLYGGAIKTPLTKKWVKTMVGKDVSRRTLSVEEGIRSGINPSEFGLSKIKQLKREVGGEIGKALDIISQNPKSKIKVDDVLETGLRRAYKEASVSSDPVKSTAVIDKIKKGFEGHGEYLTPKIANDIKIKVRKEFAWTEGADELTVTAKKGVARDLMERIESSYPPIKKTNEVYEARRSLEEAIERAIGRNANTNLVPLGTKFLLTNPKTWPLALWDATVGHPQVKAHLAFFLAKGNPQKYGKFLYPEMPQGYIPASGKIESIIYRYKPETKFTKSTIPKALNPIIREGETPKIIINKSKALRMKEETERLKQLEIAFAKMDAKKMTLGPPLIKPNKQFVKSTIPNIDNQIKGLMR